MLQLKSPGVYIDEINSLPSAVVPVETAIPVFIGYTALSHTDRVRHRKPVRITSWMEYLSIFGTPPSMSVEVNVDEYLSASNQFLRAEVSLNTSLTNPQFNMYYSIQHYFANGGGPCYVLSVMSYTVATGETTGVTDGSFRIDHFTGGTNFVSVFSILEEYDEPTLIVIPDACLFVSDAGTGYTKFKTIVNAGLMHCKKMKDRFMIIDTISAAPKLTEYFITTPTAITAGNLLLDNAAVTGKFRTGVGSSADDLMYGAAYYPYLNTSINFVLSDANIKVATHDKITPSGTTPGGPTAGVTLDNNFGTVAAPDYFKKKYNHIYNAIWEFLNTKFVVLPPSGAIAGIYCSTDRTRGVWKAPANVGINQVISPAVPINTDFNDNLNSDTGGKSVNAIRSFTGKGTLVWGGRTLNANDLNWRFVNVRREVIFIEESISKALESFVFEPNTANTWTKAKAMVENFLTLIWRQGGLAGAKPEDAFQVNVGLNVTMSAIDVAAGMMIVEIVLVPPRPAEVIVLRVSQKLQVS